MILPSVIMDGVFEYFDTVDLARIAQVNKAWRAIVYRKSVWATKYWSLKREPGVVVDKVPKDARHIGAPHSLCFATWLFKTFEHRGERLPIHLLHTEDSNKFILEARKFWNARGRPCTILDHHEPTHLLTMKFPKSMTLSDKKRILARLIKPSIRGLHRDTHEYSRYIQHMLCASRGCVWDFAEPINAPNPEEKNAADPLLRYRYEAQAMLFDRFKAVETYKERVYATYTSSILALRTHGLSEFTGNDTAFQKTPDDAWADAAFRLPGC
jgi:hypothetical protein